MPSLTGWNREAASASASPKRLTLQESWHLLASFRFRVKAVALPE
jgi:hypothetical protein